MISADFSTCQPPILFNPSGAFHFSASAAGWLPEQFEINAWLRMDEPIELACCWPC